MKVALITGITGQDGAYLAELLLEKGAEIIAYDAIAEENVRRVLGDKISYAPDMYSALDDADCLLIATEWPEFKNPNFKSIVLVVFEFEKSC